MPASQTTSLRSGGDDLGSSSAPLAVLRYQGCIRSLEALISSGATIARPSISSGAQSQSTESERDNGRSRTSTGEVGHVGAEPAEARRDPFLGLGSCGQPVCLAGVGKNATLISRRLPTNRGKMAHPRPPTTEPRV